MKNGRFIRLSRPLLKDEVWVLDKGGVIYIYDFQMITCNPCCEMPAGIIRNYLDIRDMSVDLVRRFIMTMG